MKSEPQIEGSLIGDRRPSAVYASLAVGVALLTALAAGAIDRQVQIRSVQALLDAEVVVRGQSLRDTLEKYRIVSVLAARGDVVQAMVALDRQDERLIARLRALASMSNIRAFQLRVARSGNLYATHTPEVLDRQAVLEPGMAVARQGRLGRLVLRDEAAHPIYIFFAPVFGEGRIDGMVLAAVDLEALESIWSLSQSAVLVVDESGTPVLWNRASGGAPLPSIQAGLFASLDLPDLGLKAYVGRPAPAWIGPWLLRPAAIGLLVLLLAVVFFSLFERRRYLTALAEARRIDAELLEAEVAARTQELERAQDQVVQAGKLALLGQMSASISHEINQPLGAIKTYCETAGRFLERDDGDRARQNLGHIDRLVGRISRIVTNLRSFATSEPQAPRPIALGSVVETASGEFLDRFPESKPYFSCSVDPAVADAHVMAGEVRLLQVINNLLTNAWMATRDQRDARIVLSVGRDQAGSRIEVADNGPGIPETLNDQVFEAFVSTRSPGSGMGLGLTISRSFIDSMGGSIDLEPREDGGARFVIRLRPAER